MLVPGRSSSECNIVESAHSNPPLYEKQIERLSEVRTHKLITFVRSGTNGTRRNLSPSEEKTIGRKNTSESMAVSKYSMSNKLMSVKPNAVKGDTGVSSVHVSAVEVAAAFGTQRSSAKHVSHWEATTPALEESDRDSTPEKRRTDNFKKKSNGQLLRNATLGAPVKHMDTDLAEDSMGVGLQTGTNGINSGKSIQMAPQKNQPSAGAKPESVNKNFLKEALNFSLPGNIKSILVKRNKSVHGI